MARRYGKANYILPINAGRCIQIVQRSARVADSDISSQPRFNVAQALLNALGLQIRCLKIAVLVQPKNNGPVSDRPRGAVLIVWFIFSRFPLDESDQIENQETKRPNCTLKTGYTHLHICTRERNE
jgi:hypothetical protein